MLVGVLLGITFTAWVFTMAAVSYVLWRYAFKPWQIMRKDLTLLNQKVDENREWTKNELGLRAARVLSDEEQARMESVLRRQNVWGRLGGQA